MPSDRPASVEVRADGAVSDVPAGAWDAVVAERSPFLAHGFLASLEASGCVDGASGWSPRPITCHADGFGAGGLVGVAPAYVKAHSMGEFVYDWAWADAAQRAGVGYYPKLVIAAPFSPVSGPRLVAHPDLDDDVADTVRRGLLSGAVEVARHLRCHGVHVLFGDEADQAVAESLGFVTRLGLQFHWDNAGYGDFDAFLGRFKSKRRNQIRRERRRVHEAGIDVHSYRGAEVLDAHRPLAFEFYRSTVDKFFYGRRYLNEAFFEQLWQRLRPNLQLTLAETADGDVVAGALNLERSDGGARFGRYWGCSEDYPFLHFEVCSYAPIADCIAKGVGAFEAGAGGGHHKYGRGFLPMATRSFHLHFDPRFQSAIADFCGREADAVRDEADALRERLFVR